MVTIKDIARRLEVSASTVGRALSDDPRISAAMKQKVAEVANELGYVANRAARMMRGASSNLVGLVVPDIRNSFYSTIAHALSKCLESADLQLTLSETDDDRLVELRHIRELTSVNVAGIIIVPTARPHPESVRLLKMTPRIQLLRRHAALGEHWFGIDDAQALFQATRHLVELGHQRIAYIGGTTDLPTGAARLQGFQNALAGSKAATHAREELGAPASTDFGRDAIRRLLALRTPPTAVVLGSVQNTQGVLEELLASGVRVPEQLSVVGFGDELGFRWWGPGLTTVSLPVSELATACGLWFIHQLKQKPESATPYSSVSPPTLVVRGSTRALETASAKRGQARLLAD
ncbi:LacI family DNA-binding transcriptional regulator [Variovorax paradoxus]|jgi:DNA-binding LacI/PurR family transcriptional regulator|uniref:LacI family DNA-binding transcriptional regulator n=1 Tax=Variovorax paradoxus TaxID=34073 RepID=UPI002788E24E|nr:LacI family DNA-binding transcriptional regulator [Variovorax paradoxus]MDP9928368.1 LacI family transcriptional regulator [Variovorax paradoxus]